jgi:hypothetical protein
MFGMKQKLTIPRMTVFRVVRACFVAVFATALICSFTLFHPLPEFAHEHQALGFVMRFWPLYVLCVFFLVTMFAPLAVRWGLARFPKPPQQPVIQGPLNSTTAQFGNEAYYEHFQRPVARQKS